MHYKGDRITKHVISESSASQLYSECPRLDSLTVHCVARGFSGFTQLL